MRRRELGVVGIIRGDLEEVHGAPLGLHLPDEPISPSSSSHLIDFFLAVALEDEYPESFWHNLPPVSGFGLIPCKA